MITFQFLYIFSQRDLIKHQVARDIIWADGFRDRKMISYNRATFNEKPGIKKKSLIPLVFFIVALLINLIGVKYGFPVLTHNDEPAIIDPVIKMTNNRTLKIATLIVQTKLPYNYFGLF